MTLVFNDTINNLLLQDYETTLKIFILFGTFMFAMYYIHFSYENQKPTNYFFLGTLRFMLYGLSLLWSWLFFLVMAVFLHPNVSIDPILIFLTSAYSIGFFMFSVLFISNSYLKMVYLVVKFGKIDIKTTENEWIKKNYQKYLLKRK